MSLLKSIKEAASLADFSKLLGFSPHALSYILYVIPKNKKYVSFQIRKKNGKFRKIQAPEDRLKKLQRRLANLLNSCAYELDRDKSMKPLAHGFKKKLSIYTNAKLHKNRRYVLNFDLEDFFPSINFGRVRGYFIKNRDFELNEKIATILAQIACHKNELPQGSPCSPIISNFIAHLLDVRLVKLAKQFGCSYSRYADDITFSTNQNMFPREIAYQDKKDLKVWHLSKVIKEQVKRTDFKINSKKTHMRFHNSRQMVTGLVVNEKINVRVEYYKLARAMTHSLFKTGEYTVPAYLSPIDMQDSDPTNTPETGLNRLEGILNHIHYTRNYSDQRNSRDKEDKPTAIWKLFKDFLYFKHFGSAEKPVIYCEGDSDSIYLKLALKKLKDDYPYLVEMDDDKFHFKIKFFKRTSSVRDLLKFRGGTGEMAGFIGGYRKKVATYLAWSFRQPVIILTDNDDGATPIFSSVEKSFEDRSQSRPSFKDKKSFYHINSNLYFIKTPHVGNKEETMIEDLFDPKWLKIEINGKKFGENKTNDKKFYGKIVLAEQVIRKNFDKINFDKFAPLLDRIVDVIKFHSKSIP